MTEIWAADEWRARLREALVSALRERRADAVRALRSTLSAIDNAEAIEATDVRGPDTGAIAGAVAGLGAAEVPRKQLSGDEVRAIIRREIDERRTGALEYERAGHPDRASALRAEASVVELLMPTLHRP